MRGQVTPGVDDHLLSLRNNLNEEVGSINASGSAQFNSIAAGFLGLKADPSATSSATQAGGIVYESTASAGEALIPAGETEITIKNPNIRTTSLVYLTPTTSTKDSVLYVKSKESCESGGVICVPYMVVGFDKKLISDVSFNWWLVDLQKSASLPR